MLSSRVYSEREKRVTDRLEMCRNSESEFERVRCLFEGSGTCGGDGGRDGKEGRGVSRGDEREELDRTKEMLGTNWLPDETRRP